MRILITGVHSYIGTSFQTYMASRQPDWQIETVSLRDEQWRKMRFSRYDTVLHTAGIAHADRGKISRERGHLYYQVNTELAVETAEKAKADGAGQFLYLSSAIIYGNSAPIGKTKVITEETPPAPQSCYGDSKLQAELRLRPLDSPDFHVAILRLPMVYGPGSKGNYLLLAKAARRIPVFPMIRNQRSMLYVENLCEFLRLVIKNRESGTFYPQNGEYVCTSEMVKEIAQAHSHRLWLVKGFQPMLRLAEHGSGLITKVFGNLAYAQDLSQYPENYRVCSFAESIRRTEQK